MPFQYTYHIEYRDDRTGLSSVWPSKEYNKRAAIQDFQKLFGANLEILKAFIATSDEIKAGISNLTPKSVNQLNRLNYYTHYCPTCLDNTAHLFKDYEHEDNDMLGEDDLPVVVRRCCVRCGNIHLHYYPLPL